LSNYVVCLKYGNKYSASYVNRLYNMVQRNLTLDYEFVCFTEDATGLDARIRVESLALVKGIEGWWYKPMFFNPALPLNGTILFLDLDVVIFRNIDTLFTYKPGEFLIIRDFNRHIFKEYKKFNSSVFRLTVGQHSHVYENFIKDSRRICRQFKGDQDWIYAQVTKDFSFWPTEWIQSYKWEMRSKTPINRTHPKGERDFIKNGNPSVLEDTSIAVFHGDPNPHHCKDPWVIEHWR